MEAECPVRRKMTQDMFPDHIWGEGFMKGLAMGTKKTSSEGCCRVGLINHVIGKHHSNQQEF